MIAGNTLLPILCACIQATCMWICVEPSVAFTSLLQAHIPVAQCCSCRALHAVCWLATQLCNASNRAALTAPLLLRCVGDCPDYRWCYSGSTPTASGLRALAAAATAAMQDSSSGGSGINGAAGQKPSEHHKLRLSSFSLSCCTGGSSSSGGGGSPGAAAEWQAAIAAAAARLGGSSSVSFDPLLPHVCRCVVCHCFILRVRCC